MNCANLSIGSTGPSPKSALALMLLLALFAMLSIATTGCKTKKMSQELQYDRQVITSSEATKNKDIQDLSTSDITIIDFDTLLDERSGLNPLELLDPNPKIHRLTLIHRQNNIQTTETNKSLTQTKDSLKTQEIVKNKASPDKGSQVVSIVVLIIILSIIILIIIVLRMIS